MRAVADFLIYALLVLVGYEMGRWSQRRENCKRNATLEFEIDKLKAKTKELRSALDRNK